MYEPPRRLRTVLLYATGHVGGATVMSRVVEASEVEIVRIVRAAPIAFTRAGLARLAKHWRPVFTRHAKTAPDEPSQWPLFDAGVQGALRPRGPLDSDDEIRGAT